MYRLRVHIPLMLTLILATLVLSPTILPARGVIAYTPGVIGGQWALYKQQYSNCMPPNPALCGSKTSSLDYGRSEEHTSELQSQSNLVCRLLLEKQNKRWV